MWRTWVFVVWFVWGRLAGRQAGLRYLCLLLPPILLIGACAPSRDTTATPVPRAEAVDHATETPSATATAVSEAPVAAGPTSSSTVTAAPSLPYFESSDCRFTAPSWPEIKCGDLLVFEDRHREDSPVIRLHVAVLKSPAESPEPDPLIYLSGGPGSLALEWLQYDAAEYQDILKQRDVIFFDQRGIGYSLPSLDCPEVSEQFQGLLDKNLKAAEWVPGRVAAHAACGQRLVEEGIDLSAYNSASSAADINDLRQALGYEQVNLLGRSYGTRLALTTMRDFPEAVRSAILDSPVPLQVDLLADQGPLAQEALQRIFDKCAADQACAAAFPDLAAAFDAVLQRLDREPLAMHVSGFTSRSLTPAKINGDFFVGGLFFSLYEAEDFYRLPKIIYDSYQQSPGYKNRLVDLVRLPMFLHQISSEGQRYAVLCSEEIPFTTLEAALAHYDGMDPYLRAFLEHDMRTEFAICDAWSGNALPGGLTGDVPAVENVAVRSDIPTLVLTGALDPVTPPAFGDLALESLPNGFHVEFPYASHGVYSEHQCARQVTAGFLHDPGVEPDLACIDDLRQRPAEFVID